MDLWDQSKIDKEIRKVPSENLIKFQLDFQTLIKLAQKDNYEDFCFPRR